MASQIGLIESFRDTQIQVKQNAQLAAATEKMCAKARLYLDRFQAYDCKEKSDGSQILVMADTTFHCAQSLITSDKKVAVLNFSNAYTPGGGVKQGAMAQEECLCRSSNLYESLVIPYFIRHYYKWNQKNTGDMGSDLIIYTPDVTVFKTDDTYPENMSQWFNVDVISCAAPYYDAHKKNTVSMEKLEEVFVSRITNIFEVAMANDVDVLVLGAFGCGAFNNPPQLVASVFHKLLVKNRYAKYFEKIVFAIKKTGDVCQNLEAFMKTFEQKEEKTL